MPLIPTASQDDSSDDEELKALQTFVVECGDLLKLERRLRHFNFFEVLGLAEHEIRHSNVLAWLFDPAENHGLRDLFLRRWLTLVCRDNVSSTAVGFDPVDVACATWLEVRVLREWKHIDLLIEMQDNAGKKWEIIIENKVRSSQHTNQLTRYRTEMEKRPSVENRAFILLSVDEEQPEDHHYIVATYKQVRAVLRACMKEQRGEVAAEPRMLLEDYCKVIESRFMPNSKIEKLAQKIYARHRQALDIIFEHRPDLAQELSDELGKIVVADALTVRAKFAGKHKGKIYLLPDDWAFAGSRNEKAEIAWVTIEFTNMREVLFRPVAKLTEPDWRNNLFAAVLAMNLPDSNRYKTIPVEWPLYSPRKSNLGLDRADSDNLASLAETIWKWCTTEMQSDRFREVSKQVAEELRAASASPLLPRAEEA